MRFNSRRSIAIMAILNFKRLYQLLIPSFFIAGFFYREYATISSAEVVASFSPLSCIFHELTSWLCPGCGMTRSLICFFSGNLYGALYFNPLGLATGLILLCLWGYSFCSKKFTFESLLGLLPLQRSASVLLVLLSWGLLRNFSWL